MKQRCCCGSGAGLRQEPANTTTLLSELRLFNQSVEMERQKKNKDEQEACNKTRINENSFCQAGKAHENPFNGPLVLCQGRFSSASSSTPNTFSHGTLQCAQTSGSYFSHHATDRPCWLKIRTKKTMSWISLP